MHLGLSCTDLRSVQCLKDRNNDVVYPQNDQRSLGKNYLFGREAPARPVAEGGRGRAVPRPIRK